MAASDGGCSLQSGNGSNKDGWLKWQPIRDPILPTGHLRSSYLHHVDSRKTHLMNKGFQDTTHSGSLPCISGCSSFGSLLPTLTLRGSWSPSSTQPSCYKLSISMSPKFTYLNPTSQYDDIRRWGLWGVIR